ncbi:MAG TPA: Flp pilus assembly protein CpaB [Vicinamibacterales bacterium]|nr:Flp pilus assembly protein CpaB [Vicinamibacterales bacterium]
MMKPRNMLIIAGVLGAVAVVLLQVESWRSRGGTVQVFKATQDIRAGATLKGAYQTVAIPADSYESMRATVPTADLEAWVANAPTLREVRAGQTITFDMLQKSADGLRITPGMRAVAIEVQAAQAVGYLIRPGDYVDVLGTVPHEKDLVTKHLLQVKHVLAVDQQYRLEDSAFLQHPSYSTVTLEVTPEEAEVLEAYRMMVKGGFSLSLRPRGDLEKVETPSYPITDLTRQ